MPQTQLAYRLGVWIGTRRALHARPLVLSAWTERDGRRERHAITPERFEALVEAGAGSGWRPVHWKPDPLTARSN